MTQFRAGDVVEYIDDSEPVLGVVREVGEKVVILFGEDGDERRINRSRIDLRVGMRLTPSAEDRSLLTALASLRQQANERALDANLEELWTFARDAELVLTVETAADLLFGNTSGVDRLALVIALRTNPVYFKRRGEELSLRSELQVGELRRMMEKRRAEERGRAGFVHQMATILAKPAEERKDAIHDARSDDMFRRYLDLLAEYASGGDEVPASGDANQLIEEIQQAAPIELPSSRSERAMHLLMAAGFWSRDHNLLLSRYRIPTRFPSAVLEAAETLVAETPCARQDEGRLDLTRLTCVTIDDPETLDLDDAVSVDMLPSGRWRVGVHIADPTGLVPMDSILEREARRRGTSVYLPDRTIPMFPGILSHQLFSLVEGEPRRALSFFMEMDDGFAVLDEEIVRSVIVVDERLDYEQVDELIESGEGALSEVLRNLYMICDSLAADRRMSGHFSIDLPVRKVRVEMEDDREARVVVDEIPAHSISRDMVMELMVQANTMMGRYCSEHGLMVPYRVQEPPNPPIEPDEFDHIVEGLPREMAKRRRMMPARTSLEAGPHFALGVDTYVQATSPIRRYTDLLAHYQLTSHLQFGLPGVDDDLCKEALFASSHAAGDASRVSRETERYWLLRYLEQTANEPRQATVIGYGGSHNQLASVLMHDTMLRTSVALRKKVPVGSVVTVEVMRAQPRANVFALRVIERG